jgi:queuine tRNA-ribosyltransferase
MSRLDFQVERVAAGSQARAARFRTLHNEVRTPLFMPVGTHATVRGLGFKDLELSGAQILLANTYHLLLRPGAEVFRALGGIHGFTGWRKSFLTDSGGFQIFCMPGARKMSEEGARFLSYVDGKHILLTPELSIEMQKAIGSDIMMVLDQCVPSTVSKDEARAAMELSNRWALRSLAARQDSPQSLFAIVQGACVPDLRTASAEFLTQHPFDGFALGGLAVGEEKAVRDDTIAFAAPLLPADRPRYLMGVGTPLDLLEAVHRGMDMFDCIIPTAHGEQGLAYTEDGKLSLRRSVYKLDTNPIDKDCPCPACTNHTRAYLHHLVKVGEPLGRNLIGLHNVFFFQRLMAKMRETILHGDFLSLYNSLRNKLGEIDPQYPPLRPPASRSNPLALGDFQIVEKEGISRILKVSNGEVMHPGVEPEVEARALYLDQSKILECEADDGPLVVWDVGLGAAANAMVLVDGREKQRQGPPLQLVSFETDLDSLRLAALHPEKFSYLKHGAHNAILNRGYWTSKKAPIDWRLLGDFFSEMESAPPANFIYFDMYSAKSEPEQWSLDQFRRIFSHAAPGAQLFTYTTSSLARATMLRAGFWVADGAPVGTKGTTTKAWKPGTVRPNWSFLGTPWLDRWKRSGAQDSLSPTAREETLRTLSAHPQFQV